MENGGGSIEQACGRSSGRATEDLVRERRNFQKNVDGGKKRYEQHGKPADELCGRNSARRREAECPQHEIPDHVHDGSSNDLVEGVLDKTAKPTPEKPLHPGDDKKWNEDRSHQHANSRGDKSVSDHHNRDRLSCCEENCDDDINGRAENISPGRRIHAGLKVRNLADNVLKLGLIDLARQKLRLVGHEIVEARADAWKGSAVVVDHREAKTDGEQQARKMIELERRPSAGRGERGLDSNPSNQNGGERAEQVLAHGVEEAEVLGEQVVDRLKDVLEEIGLHCRQLPRRLGVPLRTSTACGSSAVNR